MPEPIIIYKDENVLAIDKPAGLLVHGAKVSSIKYQVSGKEKTSEAVREKTLIDWLLKKYPEIKSVGDDPETRPGIVHRLDRDTSGVMLVARNQQYFEYLKKLFQAHEVKKTYIAVVYGKLEPPRGVIDAPIGLKTGTVRRSTLRPDSGQARAKHMKMVKNAVTAYRVIKYVKGHGSGRMGEKEENCSLVEVLPKTGRTHQIRVHLASIGHPIVGDALYGKKIKGLPTTRLMLHSFSIEFTAEDGKRLKISAEQPTEFSMF